MSAEGPVRPTRRAVVGAASAAALAPAIALGDPRRGERLQLGRDQSFDRDWRFFLGAGDDFETPALDDAGWRVLDLPHDWSIEDLPPEAGSGRVGPFDPKALAGAAVGFTTGGQGWYRKHFTADGLAPGAQVEILFGGAYCETQVWLNGRSLGEHVHGYTPFHYDLTPYLRAGDNVLAVCVRDVGRNSRWYAGSGLYRGVTLDVVGQAGRVARWGVGVSTQRITGDAAEIAVETRLTAAGPHTTVLSRVRAPDGAVVAQAAASARDLVAQTLSLPSPELWSPDTPRLYTLETELRRGETVVDRVSTPFGVRVVTFDAEHGMRINGVETKLRGGCLHHDNGLLGACAYPDAEARRVRLLKARGFNAVRSSHNPCSRAFADACDRHGVLLIEEAFDCWFAPKNPQDYSTHFATHAMGDLEAMVLSARNHPSVVMWSIGNEIPRRSTPEGIEVQWRLANAVHRLDPTRPVTAAINAFPGRPVVPGAETARPGAAGQPAEAAVVFLDVVGYNYRLASYAPDHALYPSRVMFGSESYAKELFDDWAFIEKNPYVVGDFVWSGMDYLGEAGMGYALRNTARVSMPIVPGWPWIVNNQGDLDITGRQKPQSLARDVAWGVSPLEVAVFRPLAPGAYEHVNAWGWSDESPSWTWPGHEGQPLTVRVYTRAERVDLHLNGKAVASRTLGPQETLPVELVAPYQPGVLEAVAYAGGREIGRRRLETVGAAAALQIAPESPGGGDARRGRLSYVWIEMRDAQDRLVRDGAHLVRLSLSGPAELVGFGGGGPDLPASFQSPAAQTHTGRALAILRSTGSAGAVRIQASSEGLRSAATTLSLA